MKGKKKILLVEDELILREIYQDILSNAGFSLDIAKEGNSALEKMTKGGYDLVLLDVMLPNKDGIQILTSLNKTPPQKPIHKIVFMTNLAQDNLISKASEYGVKDIIIKSDITPDAFLNKINKFLEN